MIRCSVCNKLIGNTRYHKVNMAEEPSTAVFCDVCFIREFSLKSATPVSSSSSDEVDESCSINKNKLKQHNYCINSASPRFMYFIIDDGIDKILQFFSKVFGHIQQYTYEISGDNINGITEINFYDKNQVCVWKITGNDVIVVSDNDYNDAAVIPAEEFFRKFTIIP